METNLGSDMEIDRSARLEENISAYMAKSVGECTQTSRMGLK